MRTFSILLALTVIAAIAQADENGCETTEPTATLETPIGTYYVWNDPCQLEGQCLISLWLIEESNGEPGLQMCRGPICGHGCDTIIV